MAKRAEILEELRRETEYYAPHTVRQYFIHASNYLDYVGTGDWKNRDVLYTYVQRLKKQGKSQSHINYITRGPIGALFRAHGLKIPIKLPRPRVGSAFVDFTERVSFTDEEVIGIIKAARAGKNKQTQAILAVATIYGPRAVEIRTMRREDIHPKKKTLVIHTVKGSFKREHVIPAEIYPLLSSYDFPNVSGDYLSNILKRAAEEAGVDTRPRKSYHAIRHGLINAMFYTSSFSLDVISKFCAWRVPGMAGQYVRPFPFLPEIDEQVFAKHPFLDLWVK